MNIFNKLLKPKIKKIKINVTIGEVADCCPNCRKQGDIFLYTSFKQPFYLCENCNKISSIEEFKHYKNIKLRKEKLNNLKINT